ncbi:MAG: hypothetical protein ACQETR_13570 [Thermodesulfobacteriota bacterium]
MTFSRAKFMLFSIDSNFNIFYSLAFLSHDKFSISIAMS